MKVKDLIKELSTVDPDLDVILQKDAEGNDYSPLDNLYLCGYQADSTWSGTAGLLELTDEDRKRGYTEEDLVNGVPALFLVPVN